MSKAKLYSWFFVHIQLERQNYSKLKLSKECQETARSCSPINADKPAGRGVDNNLPSRIWSHST